MAGNVDGLIYTMMCPKPPPSVPKGTPEFRAIDPQAEKAAQEQQRRNANNLGIALLGPVFGAPAAGARLAGAPQSVIDGFAEFGLNVASGVSLKGAGGARVFEPAITRNTPTISAPGAKQQGKGPPINSARAVKPANAVAKGGTTEGAVVKKLPRYGPFYRLPHDPKEIENVQQSGEVRGQPARNTFASDIPKVKAYDGPLPEGSNGYEFYTNVPPDMNGVPGKPTWSGPRGQDWTSIPVEITGVNK